MFSEIRNEHFSNVFGFLSQKARNLQAQYDVRLQAGVLCSLSSVASPGCCPSVTPLLRDRLLVFCLQSVGTEGGQRCPVSEGGPR